LNRRWVLVAALAAAIAVGAGAFGAHSLKARLGLELLAVWETAARYQMYHALALLAVAAAAQAWRGPVVRAAGWLFVVGMLLFCGSLYLLALTGVSRLGAITPIGGVAFIAGWCCLAWAAMRAR